MFGHRKKARELSGRAVQLVTGSTGLDDWEWAVAMFADDVVAIKACVHGLSFDEVPAGLRGVRSVRRWPGGPHRRSPPTHQSGPIEGCDDIRLLTGRKPSEAAVVLRSCVARWRQPGAQPDDP